MDDCNRNDNPLGVKPKSKVRQEDEAASKTMKGMVEIDTNTLDKQVNEQFGVLDPWEEE